MAWIYGDGRPLKNPGFVTGFETPSQRQKRLREINDVLAAKKKQEEERASRQLLSQFERQAKDFRFSPPSPPRSPDIAVDLDAEIQTRVSWQDRYEGFLDNRIEDYEARYGMTPTFDSQGYASAEFLAPEDWTKAQDHVPTDLVQERAGIEFGEVGLLIRSREFREGFVRPAPDVDSKYDIMVDTIVEDVAAG